MVVQKESYLGRLGVEVCEKHLALSYPLPDHSLSQCGVGVRATQRGCHLLGLPAKYIRQLL